MSYYNACPDYRNRTGNKLAWDHKSSCQIRGSWLGTVITNIWNYSASHYYGYLFNCFMGILICRASILGIFYHFSILFYQFLTIFTKNWPLLVKYNNRIKNIGKRHQNSVKKTSIQINKEARHIKIPIKQLKR